MDVYEKMGCRMSQKLHVLQSHIDQFKGNMGDYSEEQVKGFTKISNRLRNAIKASTMKVWWGTTFRTLCVEVN